MNFRVLPALYDQLAEVARREGHSISEEVATRLGRSFQVEQVEARRFGEEGVAYLANIFAGCVNIIQKKTGKKAWEDAETREAIKDALCAVIDASTDIFKDVNSISQMQARFDRDTLRQTWEQLIEMAEKASAEPKLSLAEIMGR